MTSVVTDVQALAHRALGALTQLPGETPQELLRAYPWDVPIGNILDHKVVNQANLSLSAEYCLGRTAQAAALVELRFPGTRLQLAEVTEDWFVQQMHALIRSGRASGLTAHQERLMYEEPHVVLLINGEQFEPISLQVGREIIHPKVQPFPIWEGVAVGWLVALAHTQQPEEMIATLETAESLCPGSTLVAENRCAAYLATGRNSIAMDIMVRELLPHRKTARLLYMLWRESGESRYHTQLLAEYGEDTITLIQKEVDEWVP